MKHSHGRTGVYDVKIVRDRLSQLSLAELGWFVRYRGVFPEDEMLGLPEISCEPMDFMEGLALALFDHLWDAYPDRRGRVVYDVDDDGYAKGLEIWNDGRRMFVGFSRSDVLIYRSYYDHLTSTEVGLKMSVALEDPKSLDLIEHEFEEHGWPVELEEAWRQAVAWFFQ